MLDKQALVFMVIALAGAAAALLAALEPQFGQTAGAPIGLAIVSAGFAIAAALSPRR